jgi:hypothetical protein
MQAWIMIYCTGDGFIQRTHTFEAPDQDAAREYIERWMDGLAGKGNWMVTLAQNPISTTYNNATKKWRE